METRSYTLQKSRATALIALLRRCYRAVLAADIPLLSRCFAAVNGHPKIGKTPFITKAYRFLARDPNPARNSKAPDGGGHQCDRDGPDKLLLHASAPSLFATLARTPDPPRDNVDFG
jgi:hypothetical protein